MASVISTQIELDSLADKGNWSDKITYLAFR
jgi:hypothetical protein